MTQWPPKHAWLGSMVNCGVYFTEQHIYFLFLFLPVSVDFLIPALQSLWGQGDYKQEMDEMLAEQAVIQAAPPKSPVRLLRDRTIRWQLITIFLIYTCNMLSGMPAVRMQLILTNYRGCNKMSTWTIIASQNTTNVFLFSSFQITVFSYDIFLKAGIPSDKISYMIVGLGLSEITSSVLSVSNSFDLNWSSLKQSFCSL